MENQQEPSALNQHPFLMGGGEMGALTRATNWSKTPVGAVGQWPQSLQTTLGILLNSKFPMFLFWGPELICFYNDAYRPSLGQNGKHPFILGMPATVAWPEIWAVIKPFIDQVLNGREATSSEDQLIPIYRNGKLEDVYWTFSYSPVIDESGNVGGVLVTCNETTDKVLAYKNLKQSKDQLHFAIEAAELGTWEYNPATREFNCNKRLMEWFGLNTDDNADLAHVLTTINEADLKKIGEAVNNATQSANGNFEVEFTIKQLVTDKELILRSNGKVWHGDDNVSTHLNGTMQNVTERVRAQREINESERNLRLIIMQAPVAIAILRGDRYIVEIVNANALQLWGRTNDDVFGKPILEVMMELEAQGVKALLDDVYQTGEPFSATELPVAIVRNGVTETVYVNFVYEPLYDASGQINGIITVGTDVTANVMAFKKIEESQSKLNIIIKASELGTWELNLLTGKVEYSDRYLEIFGYHEKQGALNHAQLLTRIHPEDRPIRDAAMAEAMKTGIVYYKSRLVWDDSTIHWIEVKGTVFFDENDNPYKLIGTVDDITNVKDHQQELEESEEKFRLLADSVPQFVWTGDAEGNLYYFNQSVFDYSGIPPQQLISEGWLQMIHPDDREQNISLWNHSIATGEVFLFEHRFRRSDGEYRWQLSRAAPQRDSSGKIQMWVGSSTDIQQIKEQDQQKDYFISMASHELRTPLTSMKGYVQLMKHKYSNSTDVFLKNSLSVIDKQIITLTALISELLDISKIKTGMLFIKKEYFLINSLVQDVVDEIKHIHPDYEVQFLPAADGRVFADRERIGQVLINFLTNAIKYSPNSPIVKVVTAIEDGSVTVSVQDWGIGINKGDQEKIFERFYRVEGKSEQTFSGFGIGLFIAAEIIEKHNGKIGVKSEPGKGSLFYFSLPIKNDA